MGPPPLLAETRQGGLQRGSSKQEHGAESRHTVGPNRRRTAQAHSQGDAGNRAPRWNHPPGRSSRLPALQAQRPAKNQELSPPHLGDLPRSASPGSVSCVPKIVLIARSNRCAIGALANHDPSRDRKWLPPLRNLHAKHNLWDTTGSVGQDGSIQQHAEEEREQEDERNVEHAARSRLGALAQYANGQPDEPGVER